MKSSAPSMKPNAHPQNEEYCPVAIYNPLTGYEPNQRQPARQPARTQRHLQRSSRMDTEPTYLCDTELDDELIGKALSSPLFIQEREEPANLRQSYHSHEESLLPAQFFFHSHKFGETRVRIQFRLFSTTEIKSRPGKRANQDSP